MASALALGLGAEPEVAERKELTARRCWLLYARDVYVPALLDRAASQNGEFGMFELLVGLQIVNALFTVLLTVRVVTQKKSDCSHAETITTLNSLYRQLDADLDDVFDRIKTLAGRKGMRAKREEDAAAPAGKLLPGETPDQWKARMRREFKANGGVRPHEET